MDFKTYYEDFFTESPFRIGMGYPDILDSIIYNKEEAKTLITNNVITDTVLNAPGSLLSVYQLKTRLPEEFYFIQPDAQEIRAWFVGTINNNTFYCQGVWNKITSKGLARWLVFEYFLKKYNAFVSDRFHTTQGEIFWKKILEKATAEQYKVTILSRNKEYDIDDTREYWGNESSFAHYQIKIYSKQ